MHGLKYTRKRYCKANKPELQPAPMPRLERIVTTDVLGTAPFVPMRVESSLVPTDGQIA